MLAYLFVVLAVAVRFMPHPWHFTPIAASLLFFGAYRSRRELWFPLVLLALSDVFLTKVIYHLPLLGDQIVTWAWYAAVPLLGTRLRKHLKPVWIMSSALASSISFFLLSNFGVWAAYELYPKTLSGLITCYAMAVPFFRGTLAGDLLFTPVLFAVPAVIRQLRESRDRGTVAAA
jgi:hypothetical protein